MSDDLDKIEIQGAVCPLPLPKDEYIVLGHGSGGKLMHDLIRKCFLPVFDNPILAAGNDAGEVSVKSKRLAISTDAHVVSPLFFPGGDIGRLAVCGTVNDIAMLGASPLYLSASFIMEEGLHIEVLKKVVSSMQTAAQEAKVQIVAGDTKVVEKGKADGLYISTTGIGEIFSKHRIGGGNAQVGDKIIVSGTIGDHGIAVLGARGDLGFDADIKSDLAPLNGMISDILAASNNIHVLRDPTRGGVATSLNEIVKQSNLGILLDEQYIPVKPVVLSACEMLGFDPLYVANEGKVLVFVTPQDEAKVLKMMKEHQYGQDSCVIGEVVKEPAGRVLMKTVIGSHRVVDVLMGEMLPRIC